MIPRNKPLPPRLLGILAAALLLVQQAVLLPAGAAGASTGAAKQEDTDETVLEDLLYVEQETYSDYYDRYSTEPRASAEVVVEGTAYRSLDDEGEGGVSTGSFGSEYGQPSRDNVLIWDEAAGSVTYAVDVPETGVYTMEFSYMPIPSNMSNIEFAIEIDGKVPYDTASRATLNKVFVNDGEITLDSRGNQVRPSQKQVGMWLTTPLMDVDGLFNDPLIFYLEKGRHDFTFDIEKGYFALSEFKLTNQDALPTYEAYKSSVGASVTPESTPSTRIRIEGENAAYKSDSTLYPTQDNASYLASPSNPAKTVYNTIGAGNWQNGWQPSCGKPRICTSTRKHYTGRRMTFCWNRR